MHLVNIIQVFSKKPKKPPPNQKKPDLLLGSLGLECAVAEADPESLIHLPLISQGLTVYAVARLA